MAVVVSKFNSVQYDGTNGTAIVAIGSSWTLISDNGTTLQFTDGEGPWTMAVGDWLIWQGSSPTFPNERISNTTYLSFYQEIV